MLPHRLDELLFRAILVEMRNKLFILMNPLSTALFPMKRKIETKYKLPLLNWVSLPPTQIAGSVFAQIDDEKVMKSLDFMDFEETFKPKRQNEKQQHQPPRSDPSVRRAVRESLLEPNRIQNVAIARKKITCSNEMLRQAIST